MENRVTAVILNWNNAKDTIDCVKSLNMACNVVIIDNGSSKEQIEILTKNIEKNVRLIFNRENTGFAKGVNQGIIHAIENSRPDFILLLNNDTVVESGFLTPLISTITKDKNIGAVQPKILKMENHKIIDSAGHVAFGYGSVRDIGIGKPDSPEFHIPREIMGACGAAVLYRTKALLDVELFDEDLFCLFEDVDISWKLQLKGYNIMYEPASIVYHKRGISGKVTGNNLIVRRFYGFRNCLLISLKYYPIFYLLFFAPVYIYRFFTALFFKNKYSLKDPFWALISKAFKERKYFQKNPLIKSLQKKWIRFA